MGDHGVCTGPAGGRHDAPQEVVADATTVHGIGDLDGHFHDSRLVRVEDPPGDPHRFPVVLGDERLVLARH